MRIDWPVLLQNPWFQLAGLVAVLAGGTMFFNLASGGPSPQLGNSAPPPTPPPIAINTPPPSPVLQAKTRGKWILDANGAPDSDSRELRVVVANLADGDIVTIRPGVYEGGVLIAKSARFIGTGVNSQTTVIRTVARDNVTVSAKNVAFENLTLGLDSAGELLRSLSCVGSSRVELDRCQISSKGRFAGYAGDQAVLNARDCSFETSGTGCAIKYLNNARGELTRCNFTANRWGPEALNSAQVRISASTFTGNGLNTGGSNVLAVSGGQARLEVNQCQFTGNPAGLLASEGGTLVVGNSRFRDNGVTGEKGNSSTGLISITAAAKATLSNLTFENNKQGIQIAKGATVTMSSCRLAQTGYRTDNPDIMFQCNSIAVSGQGTSLTVNQDSVVSGSAFNGFVVADGAHLVLEGGGVEKSGNFGVIVGNNSGPGTVELRGATFSGNNFGVAVTKGSSARGNKCQFTDGKGYAIWAGGEGASVTLNACAILRNKGVGLWVQDGASGFAADCNFDGNVYGVQAGLPNKPTQAGSLTLRDCTFGNHTQGGAAICAGSQLRQRNLRFAKGKNQGLFTDKTASVIKDELVR